ncbi:Beta-barrel assembly machine subunit BamE [Polaromonas sp. OV174]|uniref:outer membrane protein assembly factor BamE n=1 Tax=Polaromonas sp. OV174 TaxID=1855300 RepID=UPI0008F1EC40|nr:outer membrane protein assembly factor BamE [Polaromonas sp. OV174]SFC21069.1 Beta-barrel assembly machine subunit BamE [Polaromonas sp. OV174]
MSANHHYGVQKALIVIACVMLGACSSVTSGMSSSAVNPVNWITPYKVDVIQGNFVSKEQVEQLQAGMTRDQVKALMGTPLMASLFHADRWDYVFTLKRQGVEPQSFKYTVYFKADQLERFEGDAMPSEAEFISKLTNQRKLGAVPPLEATEEQLNKAAAKAPATAPSPSLAAASEPAAPTAYPPLESPKQ